MARRKSLSPKKRAEVIARDGACLRCGATDRPFERRGGGGGFGIQQSLLSSAERADPGLAQVGLPWTCAPGPRSTPLLSAGVPHCRILRSGGSGLLIGIPVDSQRALMLALSTYSSSDLSRPRNTPRAVHERLIDNPGTEGPSPAPSGTGASHPEPSPLPSAEEFVADFDEEWGSLVNERRYDDLAQRIRARDEAVYESFDRLLQNHRLWYDERFTFFDKDKCETSHNSAKMARFVLDALRRKLAEMRRGEIDGDEELATVESENAALRAQLQRCREAMTKTAAILRERLEKSSRADSIQKDVARRERKRLEAAVAAYQEGREA